MKEKEKKKKLTLTASPKKPLNIPKYYQDRKKTSVVIEKKGSPGRSEKRPLENMIIIINLILQDIKKQGQKILAIL